MKSIQNKEMLGNKVLAEWPTVYYDYLYNFASYRINDEELIKDLIQDTFLAAIEGRSNFRQNSSEASWLTAILKYKIYKNYRCADKNVLIHSSNLNVYEHCTYTTENDKKLMDFFIDPLDVKYFEKDIKEHIRTLPEKWQILYDLKYLADESTGAICKKLKLSENNYWVMSHRLKISLRTWYMTKWNW